MCDAGGRERARRGGGAICATGGCLAARARWDLAHLCLYGVPVPLESIGLHLREGVVHLDSPPGLSTLTLGPYIRIYAFSWLPRGLDKPSIVSTASISTDHRVPVEAIVSSIVASMPQRIPESDRTATSDLARCAALHRAGGSCSRAADAYYGYAARALRNSEASIHNGIRSRVYNTGASPCLLPTFLGFPLIGILLVLSMVLSPVSTNAVIK